MGDITEYTTKLKEAIKEKSEWFNQEQLPKMVENYRLLHTCVRNLYEFLVKRSLITPDPYKNDRKISEVTTPDESPYIENERGMVIGSRFSEYETMLDFVCTYVKFSVEYLDIPKIKRLNDLNNSFQWGSMTTNNTKVNTRGLATLISEAKINASQMQLSMLSDAISKSGQAVTEITETLKELTDFQREIYKLQLRLNCTNHPSFNKDKAYSSIGEEISEIKRLFPQVMGKMPFYSELVNEIAEEEHSFIDEEEPDIEIYSFDTDTWDVLVNETVTVTFTAEIFSEIEIDGNEVKVIDESNNIIGYMNDNGESGDAIANDGIYTLKVDLLSSEQQNEPC